MCFKSQVFTSTLRALRCNLQKKSRQQEDHRGAWNADVDTETVVAEAPLGRRHVAAQRWATTRRGGWLVSCSTCICRLASLRVYHRTWTSSRWMYRLFGCINRNCFFLDSSVIFAFIANLPPALTLVQRMHFCAFSCLSACVGVPVTTQDLACDTCLLLQAIVHLFLLKVWIVSNQMSPSNSATCLLSVLRTWT